MRPTVQDPPDPSGGAAGISRRLTTRVMVFASLLLFVVTGLISTQALRSFEREVVPRINREGIVIGESVLQPIARAVSLGIPLESLQGMGAFLESYLEGRPVIDYLALEGPGGRMLYQARRAGLAPRCAAGKPHAASTSPCRWRSRAR